MFCNIFWEPIICIVRYNVFNKGCIVIKIFLTGGYTFLTADTNFMSRGSVAGDFLARIMCAPIIIFWWILCIFRLPQKWTFMIWMWRNYLILASVLLTAADMLVFLPSVMFSVVSTLTSSKVFLSVYVFPCKKYSLTMLTTFSLLNASLNRSEPISDVLTHAFRVTMTSVVLLNI